MTWLDWFGLLAITGVCLAALFGCRRAERRVRKLLREINDKLARLL